MEPFKYTPFDLGRPGIRLLRLLKGEDPLIECELFQAWADGDDTDSITYEALSYTWGGTDMSASVQIKAEFYNKNTKSMESEVHVHNVTENLYLALQHLRYQEKDRILWVDAICINQEDSKERGHQVNQMRNVYSSAHQVLIWMGPATDDTDVLLDSLKQLEKGSQRIWGLEDKCWPKKWSSLQSGLQDQHYDLANRQLKGLEQLLQRPWFRRVWILQEVANARSAMVCSGSKCVLAYIFAIAPLLLGVQPKPHCQSVLDIMPGLTREGSWWTTKRDLRTLVFKFRASEAGDARDKIYALLAMCSDCQDGLGLRADYTKNLTQVVHDTKDFLFRQNEGPDTMDNLFDSIFIDAMRSLKTAVSAESQMWVSEILRSQYRGTISTEVLELAAGNVHSGKQIMSHLLKDNRADNLITRSVLNAAQGNKECGKEILEVLWKERGDELLTMVAGSGLGMATTYFHKQQDIKVKLTANVVYAAAEHPALGCEVLRLFLRQSINKVEIKAQAFDMAKFVMQRLAMSLETRNIMEKERGNMMKKKTDFFLFCHGWKRDFQNERPFDPKWSPQFDKGWEAWFNKIDNSIGLGVTLKANAHRRWDSMQELDAGKLERMYNGWKDVLMLFQWHSMQSQ